MPLYLQMSNEVPLSEIAKELKKQIKSKEKDLDIYKTLIDPRENESITVLTERKKEKEKDYKNCYWFQGTHVFKNISYPLRKESFCYQAYYLYQGGKIVLFTIVLKLFRMKSYRVRMYQMFSTKKTAECL